MPGGAEGQQNCLPLGLLWWPQTVSSDRGRVSEDAENRWGEPTQGNLVGPHPSVEDPTQKQAAPCQCCPQGPECQALVLPKGACSWAQQGPGQEGRAPVREPPAERPAKATFRPPAADHSIHSPHSRPPADPASEAPEPALPFPVRLPPASGTRVASGARLRTPALAPRGWPSPRAARLPRRPPGLRLSRVRWSQSTPRPPSISPRRPAQRTPRSAQLRAGQGRRRDGQRRRGRSGRGEATRGSRGVATRQRPGPHPRHPGPGPAAGGGRSPHGGREKGRSGHGPRPAAPGGALGARLRWAPRVQALADSARSRPERKAAVTVSR